MQTEQLKTSEIVVGMTVICQGLLFTIRAYYNDDMPIIYGFNRKGERVHKAMHISEIFKARN